MTKFQRPFFLIILLLATIAAHAQTERPARTWIGGGVIFTHSTAGNDGDVVTGAYLDAALGKYGFQARLFGEYHRRPINRDFFTDPAIGLEPRSELRYSLALVYHLPGEGPIRPFGGGGRLTIKQYVEPVDRPAATGYRHHYGPFDPVFGRPSIYDGSTHPFIVAGAGIGKRSEAAFAYYLTDTYGNSELRGYSADFTHAKKLAGRLHLRAGVKGRRWDYRKGTASEVSVFVGFHFQ